MCGINSYSCQGRRVLSVSAPMLCTGANLVGETQTRRMMSLVGRWRPERVSPSTSPHWPPHPTIEAWSPAGVRRRGVTPRRLPHQGCRVIPGRRAFPLAPMQHAMWVGHHDHQLGGVAGHLYVEFDGAGRSDRLRAAATRWRCGARAAGAVLARRHPAHPAGRIAFPISVADLRHVAPDVVVRRLAGIRDAKSHQQLDGAVFRTCVDTLLPGSAPATHVDLDMQAADATASCWPFSGPL